MKLSLATLALAAVAALGLPSPVPATNRIVFIRHAEKGCATLPGDDTCGPMPGRGDGPGRSTAPRKFPSGLSTEGKARAQYLRTLFGNASEYDFGLVFAAPRGPDVVGERTYATVAPLAADLRLAVDIGCANEPAACVADAVHAFAQRSAQDVLVCWKHRELHVIAAALGAHNALTPYPDERNDVLWIMEGGAITEKRSMHMPGLDDGRVDDGDPDLEVEGASLAAWLYRVVSVVL